MSSKELQIACANIVANVNIITGWGVPFGASLDALIKHLMTNIISKYKELNNEEVMYAFNNFSGKINNYGKNFNINLFDQVMNLFYEVRNEACIVESNILDKEYQEQRVTEQKALDASRRTLQQSYEEFLEGKFNPVESITSPFLFDTLVKDGYADEAIANDYINKGYDKYRKYLLAEKSRITSIEQERMKSYGNDDINKIAINEINAQLFQLEQVFKRCKAFALEYCFEYSKEKQIKSFYAEQKEN